MEDPKPKVHKRSRQGTASCGCPALQKDITDNLEDVNCRTCWEVMAGQRKGPKS